MSAYAPDGVPEVTAGADLVGLLLAVAELADGEIVAVTSKVVAKAEGRVVAGDRDALLPNETVRVVARRGPTTIVRTRHGLTLAAGGIDASNVPRGSVVLLPDDPDASARRIRDEITDRTGRNVGVVVTDTAGRAWREGQTDIAIGAAGLRVVEQYAGRLDPHGNELEVTAPAVADEIAGLAELAQGKLGGRPFAVVRGRADLVLPRGDHGPGAVALVRPEGADLFGYGSREAVLRAARGEVVDAAPFGSPVSHDELLRALAQAGLTIDDAANLAAVRIVAFAHGWRAENPSGDGDIGLRPVTP